MITVGPISTLPVDSEIMKRKGRWHHAAEGSRKEVMRFMQLVLAEFQIPDERTSGRELRGWAVNLCKMCKMAKNDFFRLSRFSAGFPGGQGSFSAGWLRHRRETETLVLCQISGRLLCLVICCPLLPMTERSSAAPAVGRCPLVAAALVFVLGGFGAEGPG